MSDFFTGVMASIMAGVFIGLTWAVSAAVIGDECEKMGQFYVAKKVYECKLKARGA